MSIFNVRTMPCQFAWLVPATTCFRAFHNVRSYLDPLTGTGFKSDEMPPLKKKVYRVPFMFHPQTCQTVSVWVMTATSKVPHVKRWLCGQTPPEMRKFNFEINVKPNSIHSYLFHEFGWGGHHLVQEILIHINSFARFSAAMAHVAIYSTVPAAAPVPVEAETSVRSCFNGSCSILDASSFHGR